MAQFDFEEKLNIKKTGSGNHEKKNILIEQTDVMTGDRDQRRFLYYQLKNSMLHAKRIDIIVSFLMESGVNLILPDLKLALYRGADIRILTGNYLGITQPSALYLIKRELGDFADLRFYNEFKRSFHPKAYMFEYENMSEIYIGSSNISKSALTSGIEWNYRFNSLTDAKNIKLFHDTFEDLFYKHSIVIDDHELIRYSRHWRKPVVLNELEKYSDEEDIDIKEFIQPRGAQIEALYALENSRAEGATKALINAATGVGKTYIAAFDSLDYERVLFIAHREEILKQAAESFKNVRKSDDCGFFYGKKKDTDKSVIFASVYSLGKKEYLTEEYFEPDYFDYIVIDEFHHAVNEQYKRITEYFKPEFLLGLTATPDRMDGKNIYELCDYNVPYEISLKESINKGFLVPFHYYGIYDELDYSGIRIVKGRYDEGQLTDLYINGSGSRQRYEVIFKNYEKYNSKRAMGFCCSKKHAEAMAAEFSRRGIPAVAVYSNASGEYTQNREKAVAQLKNQEIRVIFSVDMFNEGVDIESLDMVMFLRPTESPVVFLQQLGRGLRLYKDKKYLNVLDFIGNYKKASRISMLLSGNRNVGDNIRQDNVYIEYPDNCTVDFDIRLIDLFKEMNKRSLSIKERIRHEFYSVKELLNGIVPTRVELFTYMDDNVYNYCIQYSKENPFRGYMDFLKNLDELTDDEEKVYEGIGREFLYLIETTNMQKVYKMPVLYALYNKGNIKIAVTDNDVLKSWKEFFDNNANWKDFREGITYKQYKAMSDKQHISKARDMPIKHLKSSGKGFFVDKPGYAIALREELKYIIGNDAFKRHMKDILEYRTMEYYRRRYALMSGFSTN